MKIASWNVEGRLTSRTSKKRGTPEHILKGIEALDADIVVLPEAYSGAPASGVENRLRELGYKYWQDAKYNERDRKKENMSADDLHIRVLSRLAILKTEQLRWNDARGMLAITVEDPATDHLVRIIATHLDDRSEERRLAQIEDAIAFINSSNLPTVMMGDFNAMHNDKWSRLISSKVVKSLSMLIPHEGAQGLALRLTEMATGVTLGELEKRTGLRDIDSSHSPTTTPKLYGIEWMPSIRMAQIDHIFVSPEIRAVNFKIAKDGGSDHRAISADITIKFV
jgi:endonuclease/exonuclease/phosphatase family metal-dependent hydrolase